MTLKFLLIQRRIIFNWNVHLQLYQGNIPKNIPLCNQTIVDEARINLETFVEQCVVVVIHLSTLRLLEVGVTVLLLKKEKQILLVQDFSKNCQNWILEMFLEWNTAKSKFFEVFAERVCYHFLFVPFVFYLARGIWQKCDFFSSL